MRGTPGKVPVIVPLNPAQRPTTDAQAPATKPDMVWLNVVRLVAQRSRSKPRTDLFEPCAERHVGHARSRLAYAEALVRCLNPALGRLATFYRPGTEERSFDEAWLLAALHAVRRGDAVSLTFLLRRRLAKHDQRLIGFLIAQISDRAEGFLELF